MLPTSTHLTPVIGLDLHLATSGNPFHPYVGMVIAPFDYIPFLGSNVNINGLKRGVSDTSGVLITFRHIPLVGAFIMMPIIGHESVNFFSSQTVFAEGTRLSPKGYMVMTCNDVGIPFSGALSKVGKKKFKFTPTLFAPTSFSIPIPTGAPVMVGGPYAPDWGGALTGLLASIGFSTLLSFAPAILKAMKKAGKKGGNLSKAYANKARKLMGGIVDKTLLPSRKISPSKPKGKPVKPHPPFKENPKHAVASPGEFNRQLKEQQDAINKMKTKEWLENRENFKNRDKADYNKRAKQARNNYRQQELTNRTKEYMNPPHDMNLSEAEKAAQQSMKGQAALHNPDGVAGGKFDQIAGMGDSKVNSSIGSQWSKGRAASIENQIKQSYGIPPKTIADIPDDAMMNIDLF